MQISEDRVSHLAHLVFDRLWRDDLADFSDEARALACIKESITGHFTELAAIDDAVRKKLASYSNMKVPGSREWDILYQKFYQEELTKRKW